MEAETQGSASVPVGTLMIQSDGTARQLTLQERIDLAIWEGKQAEADRAKPTRVVTVRMPRKLHARLSSIRDSDFVRLSMNSLCCLAIEAVLDQLGVPEAEEPSKGASDAVH